VITGYSHFLFWLFLDFDGYQLKAGHFFAILALWQCPQSSKIKELITD